MRSLKSYYFRKSLKAWKTIFFINKFHLTKRYYLELGLRIGNWTIYLTIKNLWR